MCGISKREKVRGEETAEASAVDSFYMKPCVSLTDDPGCSTHMPVHALVTRRPGRPGPAAALAGDGVTRSSQCPPGGTLTLLAAAAWHPWVTVVTSGTPGQGSVIHYIIRVIQSLDPISLLF